MLTEKTLDAGSPAIHYVEGPPAGPPLVLLHGLTMRWQSFSSIVPLLGWRWRLYAPDFRGHGRSGRAGGAYRIGDYAGDTARLLRDGVREPAALLGWSLGALVAVEVAARAPEAVRAIVLIDPPFGVAPLRSHPRYPDFVTLRELAGSGRPIGEVSSALATLWGATPASTRGAAAGLLQVDPATIEAFLDDSAYDGFDLDARLRRIACPVLLAQADPAVGGYLTDEQADRATAALADCALMRFPGVGHGIHGQQPLPFSQLVNQFLDAL